METVFYLAMIPLGTGLCVTYAARRWLGRQVATACCALSLTSLVWILWLCLLSLFKPPTSGSDSALSVFWIAVTALLSAGSFLGFGLASRHLQQQIEGGTGITRL